MKKETAEILYTGDSYYLTNNPPDRLFVGMTPKITGYNQRAEKEFARLRTE
jgi:hypothetical protein